MKIPIMKLLFDLISEIRILYGKIKQKYHTKIKYKISSKISN